VGAGADFQSGSDFFLKNEIRFFPENRFAFEKEKSDRDFFWKDFDRDRDRDCIFPSGIGSKPGSRNSGSIIAAISPEVPRFCKISGDHFCRNFGCRYRKRAPFPLNFFNSAKNVTNPAK